VLVRIIRGKAAIELQPFRNEGKAAVPWRCKRASCPWGQQRKGQASRRAPRPI